VVSRPVCLLNGHFFGELFFTGRKVLSIGVQYTGCLGTSWLGNCNHVGSCQSLFYTNERDTRTIYQIDLQSDEAGYVCESVFGGDIDGYIGFIFREDLVLQLQPVTDILFRLPDFGAGNYPAYQLGYERIPASKRIQRISIVKFRGINSI